MACGSSARPTACSAHALHRQSPVQHDGQVWFYDPKRQTLTLKLRFGVNPSPDQDGAFDGPDNITVSRGAA